MSTEVAPISNSGVWSWNKLPVSNHGYALTPHSYLAMKCGLHIFLRASKEAIELIGEMFTVGKIERRWAARLCAR